MLLELEDGIISLLREARLNAHPWSGRPEELFEKPKYVPVIRTVIEKVDFTPSSVSKAFELKGMVAILLFFRSLRDEGQGAYPIIKKIINTLTGKTANGFLLTPKDITLLYHESGEFAYKLTFEATGRYVVPAEEEPLVKRIDFEEV